MVRKTQISQSEASPSPNAPTQPPVGLPGGEAEVSSQDLGEHERLLHSILDSTSDGVVAVDRTGRFLLFNAAAQKLVGVEPADISVDNWPKYFGLYLADRVTSYPSDDLPLVRAMRGEVVRDQEVFLRNRKRPEGVWLNVNANPLYDEQGAVLGAVCVFRDIGERKWFEQQLAKRSNEERESLGRQLHDTLGQQITGIGMIANSLRNRMGDQSPLGEMAAKLEACVETAKHQLCSLSQGLFPVAVDAHGLAIALGNLVRETADLYETECVFECPEPVLLRNNFVATELYLIAREAVHNAVKHSQPGRVVVRLQNHDGIVLLVHDNGRGIVDDAKTSQGNGIRIMHHRSGLIGGSLTIETSSGGGTTVRCSVPGELK